MNELMDVANAFTTPLKVAWIVWLAWGIGLLAWYRHQRAQAMAPKASPRPARRTSRQSRARHTEPPSRVITPAHVGPARRAEQSVDQREARLAEPAQQVEHGGGNESLPPHVRNDRPAAPAFDPSKAIVETFDARERSDLDAIVADMERHMPRGRETHVH